MKVMEVMEVMKEGDAERATDPLTYITCITFIT
jgi:hypothetical protein